MCQNQFTSNGFGGAHRRTVLGHAGSLRQLATIYRHETRPHTYPQDGVESNCTHGRRFHIQLGQTCSRTRVRRGMSEQNHGDGETLGDSYEYAHGLLSFDGRLYHYLTVYVVQPTMRSQQQLALGSGCRYSSA